MLNKCDYIVFDLETTGLKEGYHDVLQIAGKAYNHLTLEPYPPEDGGEFNTYVHPVNWDRRDPKAMEVNRITWDQVKDAPSPKVAWNSFIKWVQQFNKGKSNGVRTAPIACGKNIKGFDLLWADVLNELYTTKKKKTVIFNKRRQLDLEDQIFMWFEGSSQLENEKMDHLRTKFGISHEGAHDALIDCRQEGDLIMRFLRLHRLLLSKQNRDGRPFIPFFPAEKC